MRHLTLSLALVLASCTGTPESRPEPDTRQWYRGNLHTHSLWSDGNDLPEMICDWYKQNGYHFVAMSDHNILSDHEKWMDVRTIIKRGGRRCIGKYRARFGDQWVEMREHKGQPQVRLKMLSEYRGLLEKPGEFLLVQSEEVSAAWQRLSIHVNVTNVQEKIRPPRGESVRAVMTKILDLVEKQSAATGEPMLAHLNHPNFTYAITAEDLAHVINERFFEVWNGHPGVNHRGDEHHAGVERIWDIANTIRLAELSAPPLFGMATDDSHNYHNENPRSSITGRGWVMVRAAALTPDALIAAMQRGDFYGSSGVTLKRLETTEKSIEIEVDPVPGETYVTEFIGTREGFRRGSSPVVKDGKELRTTRRYDRSVGEVLATVKGTKARYDLTGDELYVRAVIRSSAKPDRPVFNDQVKKAWTQPVGWRHRVK